MPSIPTLADVESAITAEGSFVSHVIFDGPYVHPVVVDGDRVWPAGEEFWEEDEIAARFPLGHEPSEADFVKALADGPEGHAAWLDYQANGGMTF